MRSMVRVSGARLPRSGRATAPARPRRRVAALCAAVAGAAVGAGTDDEPRARRAVARAPRVAGVDRLTALQRAGQLVMLRFRGTAVPDYVRRALSERRAAGVIL